MNSQRLNRLLQRHLYTKESIKQSLDLNKFHFFRRGYTVKSAVLDYELKHNPNCMYLKNNKTTRSYINPFDFDFSEQVVKRKIYFEQGTIEKCAAENVVKYNNMKFINFFIEKRMFIARVFEAVIKRDNIVAFKKFIHKTENYCLVCPSRNDIGVAAIYKGEKILDWGRSQNPPILPVDNNQVVFRD